MITNQNRCILIQIGVAETAFIQGTALETGQDFTCGTDFIHHTNTQFFGQNQDFSGVQIGIVTGVGDFHCGIFKIRAH